ncbi:MAG: ATP-binding protein [Phycisphaerales bacterium]|jgi:two-component system sensor histidine kinase BarA
MNRGLSLANKCQLIFSIAVLLILAAALSVPWIRTQRLVVENQLEVSRQLAETWLENGFILGRSEGLAIPMELLPLGRAWQAAEGDPFLEQVLQRFERTPDAVDSFRATDVDGRTIYRYVRAIRASDLARLQDTGFIDFTPRLLVPSIVDPIEAVLLIDRTSPAAAGQLLRNRIWIVASGLAAGLLAVLVFHAILSRLILSPVRRLQDTVDRVRRGDPSARSTVRTGDDFEELGRGLDTMLDEIEETRERLEAMNSSLDLKVGELSEANIGLYESNRLKSEFLANVSHELKTPLNSILGFAELLDEIAKTETAPDPKRLRYLANIVESGRRLLGMIEELLAMAKIEAGRVELSIAPVSVSDLIEGLETIMTPQADARSVRLETRVAAELPQVESDAGKLQQILFNFLSNAVKFSPEGGTVTLSAERFTRADRTPGVRLSVRDEGPGVPYDMQDRIFEKFRQVDASHTRDHGGTGLGLAICRELAGLLGASVSLVSEPGRGATFAVELPLQFSGQGTAGLMPG